MGGGEIGAGVSEQKKMKKSQIITRIPVHLACGVNRKRYPKRSQNKGVNKRKSEQQNQQQRQTATTLNQNVINYVEYRSHNNPKHK